MNLDIKDQLGFIDLATYGSQARKEVHSKVLISATKERLFREGDILDANAVYQLLQKYVKGDGDPDTDYGYTSIGKFDTLAEFEEQRNRGNINDDAVYVIVDAQKVYTEGEFINFGMSDEDLLEFLNDNLKTINGQSLVGTGDIQVEDKVKNVILTQADYDALTKYDKNTIYFIVDHIDTDWVFGDHLPIILS